MVSLLFVACADLHFDEFGAWRYKGIIGDAAHGLAQVVDYCVEHRPEFLFLLGDLMNRPMPRQSAVKELCGQFDRCRAAGIPVRYVLGDHDGRQDWPGLHPWPRPVGGLLQPLAGFTAYGLDYLPRGRLQAELAAIPGDADLLFTHQKWAELVGKSGQATLTQVPAHVRHVVTGDYHEALGGDFGAGQRVWSPGSTHPTKVDEDRPRHFLVGYAAGDELDCRFEALRSRPVYRLRAETAAELAFIVGPGIAEALGAADLSRLPEPLRKPIVEVEYYTDIPDAYARIQALADRCFVFPRPRDRARERRRAVAPARDVLTLEEAVARLAAPGTPGHDWTLRLLAAKDKHAEWQAIAAEQEESRAR